MASMAVQISIGAIGAFGTINSFYTNSLLGFFPDASLFGVSATFLFPVVELATRNFGNLLIEGLDRLSSFGESKIFMDIARHAFARETHTVSPFTGANAQALRGQIGIQFAFELVTTATDLKQGLFFSWGVSFGTGNNYSFSATLYTGLVWNLPEIANYSGNFLSIGGNLGHNGLLGLGFNAFLSLDQNSKGTHPNGFTIGVSFGNSNFGLSGSLVAGSTHGPLLTDINGFRDVSPFLALGLMPAPLLIKAGYNANNQQ
jgi:hypothetical protein